MALIQTTVSQMRRFQFELLIEERTFSLLCADDTRNNDKTSAIFFWLYEICPAPIEFR